MFLFSIFLSFRWQLFLVVILTVIGLKQGDWSIGASVVAGFKQLLVDGRGLDGSANRGNGAQDEQVIVVVSSPPSREKDVPEFFRRQYNWLQSLFAQNIQEQYWNVGFIIINSLSLHNVKNLCAIVKNSTYVRQSNIIDILQYYTTVVKARQVILKSLG